jgi:hypothetical protein
MTCTASTKRMSELKGSLIVLCIGLPFVFIFISAMTYFDVGNRRWRDKLLPDELVRIVEMQKQLQSNNYPIGSILVFRNGEMRKIIGWQVGPCGDRESLSLQYPQSFLTRLLGAPSAMSANDEWAAHQIARILRPDDAGYVEVALQFTTKK